MDLKSKENLCLLKRYQAFEIQSTRALGGWLPGIERWEVKHEIGRHIWEDAQHSKEMRTRLWELRIANPDRPAEKDIALVFSQLVQAQADFEFLAGLYLVVKEALLRAYIDYVDSTYEVYDAPTIPVLRRLIAEKQEQINWARRSIAELADSGEKKRQMHRWMQFVKDLLAAVGGVAGISGKARDDVSAQVIPSLPPGYDLLLPFPEARRDSRFTVSLTGAPPPKEDDRIGQVVWQFFNYTQEMQAAESLGSVLWQTDNMPWDFYFDLARHCYDEVRHSKLGETRLEGLGHHVTDFPCSVAAYAWRQLVDPLRSYCALTYIIEAGAFKYKHETYQKHLEAGDIESAEAVLFDITDETMHVRLGKKWVSQMLKPCGYDGTLENLVDECRQLVLKHTVNPLQRRAAAS